jgi:hypothetical protein
MSRFDITTCTGEVINVEQEGDRLYQGSRASGTRPHWWWLMQDEGRTWIRGRHYDRTTPAMKALAVAWTLSGVSATHADWDR